MKDWLKRSSSKRTSEKSNKFDKTGLEGNYKKGNKAPITNKSINHDFLEAKKLFEKNCSKASKPEEKERNYIRNRSFILNKRCSSVEVLHKNDNDSEGREGPNEKSCSSCSKSIQMIDEELRLLAQDGPLEDLPKSEQKIPSSQSSKLESKNVDSVEHFKKMTFTSTITKSNREILVKADVHCSDIPNVDSDDSSSTLKDNIRQDEICLKPTLKSPCEADSMSWKSTDDLESVYVSRSEILSLHNIPKALPNKTSQLESSPNAKTQENRQKPFSPISRSAILKNVQAQGMFHEEDYVLKQRNRQNAISRSEILKKYLKEAVVSPEISKMQPNPAIIFYNKNNESEDDSYTIYSLDSNDSYYVQDCNHNIEERSLVDLIKHQETEDFEFDGQLYQLHSAPSEDSWNISDDDVNSVAISRSQILNKKIFFKKDSNELHNEVRDVGHMKNDLPKQEHKMELLCNNIKQDQRIKSLADLKNKDEKLQVKIKGALTKDWEMLQKANFGFIYVPMEDLNRNFKILKEAPDYDTFGSIDSLIFEPKSLSVSETFSFNIPSDHSIQANTLTNKSFLGDWKSETTMSSDCDSKCISSNLTDKGAPEEEVVDLGLTTMRSNSSDTSKTDHSDSGISADSSLENENKKFTGNELLTSYRNNTLKVDQRLVATNYHPDPDIEDNISDTESITSIESVVSVRHKINEGKSQTKKMYVVNQYTESDTNSELDKCDKLSSNLMDSDTSWDYVEGSKISLALKQEKNAKICSATDLPVVGNLRKKDAVDLEVKSHNFSTEDKMRKFEQVDISDGCSGVVLLKHNAYQSIGSVHSIKAFLNENEKTCPSQKQLEHGNGSAIVCNDINQIIFESKKQDHLENNACCKLSFDGVSETSGEDSSKANEKIKKVQRLGVAILGGAKNGTRIIRELKLKLRQKFDDDQINTKELSSSSVKVCNKMDSVMPEIDQASSREDKGLLLAGKESDNNASSQNKVNGDCSSECPYQLPTPDYTPLSTLLRNDRESESGSEELPPYYDTDELSFDIEDLENFLRDHSMFRNAKKESDSGKRSVRFNVSKQLSELNVGATWSDLESIIFTNDQPEETPPTAMNKSSVYLPVTRMASYEDNQSLLWDQLTKMRQSKTPEDMKRWQTEKTKRMLLWIHLSNDNPRTRWCLKSHWWKVKK